jgi:hypothetical protein
MNNQSSWGDRHDTPIDRAIDRAVRDMVQVDPALGLRHRVLSRLDASPRRSSGVPRYAWGAAMFAIVVLMLMLVRDQPSEPVTTGPVAAEVSEVAAPAPDRPVERPLVRPTPPSSRREAFPNVTREAIRMPQVENVFGAPSPSVSASAARDTGSAEAGSEEAFDDRHVAVAPLIISPLTPAPIEMPAIVIQPLGMAAPKGGR